MDIRSDDVLALIDRRIAAAQNLQTNPLCRTADRRQLEGVVNAMQALQAEVKALEEAEFKALETAMVSA